MKSVPRAPRPAAPPRPGLCRPAARAPLRAGRGADGERAGWHDRPGRALGAQGAARGVRGAPPAPPPVPSRALPAPLAGAGGLGGLAAGLSGARVASRSATLARAPSLACWLYASRVSCGRRSGASSARAAESGELPPSAPGPARPRGGGVLVRAFGGRLGGWGP